MKTTHNKKQYRGLLAMLQKVKGRTYEDMANEHGVSSRSVHRAWVDAYIHGCIDEVDLKKHNQYLFYLYPCPLGK
jgi:hypothetical protein